MQLFRLKRDKNREEPRLSYIAILLIFLSLQIVGPLLPPYYESLFVNIAFSFLILSLVFTLSFKRSLFFPGIALAILTVFFNSLMLIEHSMLVEFIYIAIALFFIGTITVIIFRRVFLTRNGDENPIFGSICIYILLGVMWALVYSSLELFLVDPFQGIGLNQMYKFQPFIYYSFVTQTTLGYGDIFPAIPIARNLATIQAIMGQFYLAILVAGLLGMMIREKKG